MIQRSKSDQAKSIVPVAIKRANIVLANDGMPAKQTDVLSKISKADNTEYNMPETNSNSSGDNQSQGGDSSYAKLTASVRQGKSQSVVANPVETNTAHNAKKFIIVGGGTTLAHPESEVVSKKGQNGKL